MTQHERQMTAVHDLLMPFLHTVHERAQQDELCDACLLEQLILNLVLNAGNNMVHDESRERWLMALDGITASIRETYGIKQPASPPTLVLSGPETPATSKLH